MKFSNVLSIASLAFASTSIAAPAEEASSALTKRAPIDSAFSIATVLYAQVQTYTGAINATSASVSKTSTPAEKKAAAASVGKQLNGITAAVKSATKQVRKLPTASPAIEKRQAVPAGPADLANIVTNIILDISGALNGIIADLGLGPLLSFLTPLVASLSVLLLALEVVVNNLLAIVQALLDGLLTGLSIGLAGLVL